MTEIRVSPEQLRSVAAQLNGYQQEVDGLLNSASGAVHNLQGKWLGMAQVDYTQVFDNEVPAMRARIAEILEGLSSELRRIAQVFEETDRQVI